MYKIYLFTTFFQKHNNMKHKKKKNIQVNEIVIFLGKQVYLKTNEKLN